MPNDLLTAGAPERAVRIRYLSVFRASLQLAVTAAMLAAVVAALPLAATASEPHGPSAPHALVTTPSRSMTGDVSGTVSDSASGSPVAGAEVSVTRAGKLVANRTSDALGRYIIHDLQPGSYEVSARFLGYAAKSRTVTVGTGDRTGIDFRLAQSSVILGAVQVTAAAVGLDTHTADQTLQTSVTQLAPTVTPTQVLQQSVAGAVKAPTGEVHIRGQHAEYTYYIDGVPVPSGVSGSLNETFDPKILEKMDFQTGGWDAEYGDKNAAIINVVTRIPAGGFHTSLGTYVGQYDGKSTNGNHNLDGQSLTLSTNSGPWGFLFTGAREYSDMRQEPVVFDTSTRQVENFHNSGFDYYGFGKVRYAPSTNDVVSLDLSLSQTLFAVPYDSSGNVSANDHQKDINSFANLGWDHLFAHPGETAQDAPELFVAGFYRHGSLLYTPGTADSPQFVFYPDTTPYNLSENRYFDIVGAKADYTVHPHQNVDLKAGTQFSSTTGHEDFSAFTANQLGPQSNSALSGNDFGIYAQTVISPVEWFELRTGVRYDVHNAPFAGTQSQVSPRIRLNFYPATGSLLYAYYGRMFIPTNVEDLRAITSAAVGDTTTKPTLPERDNFYELGWAQQWSDIVQTKLDYYYKHSTPGVDDNTVPGSSILTEVNIANIHVSGIEAVIDFRPPGPFSAYLNSALAHAYGLGPITGGFFPVAPPSGYFDLDHDQRLTITGGIDYAFHKLAITGTETYGSGLITTPCSNGCPYGTGLFDFNTGYHVPANYTTDAGVSYVFTAGSTTIRPQLYVTNLFNKQYLLKGAFFSGAWVGRPRSIQLRVNLGT